MSDPKTKLLDDLRPFLDEATILSILSDYDLSRRDQVAAARDVLLTISKDVEAEEATGFNPSGLGHDVDSGASSTHGLESLRLADDAFTTTTETSSQAFTSPSEVTSPKSPSHSESHGIPGILHIDVFDGLSDVEKERQLQEMFISLKPIDVSLALKKAKGDASIAIDELLNLQWLEQTGQRVRGVDGFYVSDDDTTSTGGVGGGGSGKKAKKGKNKKRGGNQAKAPRTARSKSSGNSAAASVSEDSTQHDEKHEENINFIADRLQLSTHEVTEIYFRQKGSSGATAVEILGNFLALGLAPSNSHLMPPEVRTQADKFSWVPQEYIDSAFEVTVSDEYALDIIGILADYYEKPAYLKYDIAYNVAASDDLSDVIDEAESSGGKTAPKTFNIRPNTTSATTDSHLRGQPTDLRTASLHAASLAATKNHSYSSATSAFKRGRSNPLYRQAAAFYSERAREQAESHRQATTIEANYLVDQQSSGGMVDLHGVTVQDGVAIALDRVWRWWEGLGPASDERNRRARAQGGFIVVTGLGRHSADGRSRLRINVFKALVADGWKIEVLTGSYLVTGRGR